MRTCFASLALLAVPIAAHAQTPDHPLQVACAPGVAADVRTARLQLGVEPAGRDTAAARMLAQRLFDGWTPPEDLGVPPLAVWQPTTRNVPYPALFERLEIVRDVEGRMVRMGIDERQRQREATPQLRAALEQRLGQMLAPAVDGLPADTLQLLFTARAERRPDAVPLGEREVRHLVSGEEPQVLRSPPPTYPKALLQDGVEGSVVVSFIVRTDSTVTAAQVVAADDPAFAQAVLDVVPRLRVAPGTAGGCVVSSVARQRFEFRLGDD